MMVLPYSQRTAAILFWRNAQSCHGVCWSFVLPLYYRRWPLPRRNYCHAFVTKITKVWRGSMKGILSGRTTEICIKMFEQCCWQKITLYLMLVLTKVFEQPCINFIYFHWDMERSIGLIYYWYINLEQGLSCEVSMNNGITSYTVGTVCWNV